MEWGEAGGGGIVLSLKKEEKVWKLYSLFTRLSLCKRRVSGKSLFLQLNLSIVRPVCNIGK